jgi:DNA-binding CsgD family transcriptional regulator
MSTILKSGFATKTDIEFVVEALLSICEPMSYTPIQHRRKERTFSDCDVQQKFYQALLLGRSHDPLLAAECKEIYDRARLTPKQAYVLELRLNGHSFDDIGRRRGRSRNATQNLFLQAIKKLSHAAHVYRYTGLADVYRSEILRG